LQNNIQSRIIITVMLICRAIYVNFSNSKMTENSYWLVVIYQVTNPCSSTFLLSVKNNIGVKESLEE
jgi:hypothetical protein